MSFLDGFKAKAQSMGGVLGLSSPRPPKPVLEPQSDEEKRQLSILDEMFHRMKTARQPWETMWKDCFNAAVGSDRPQMRKKWKSSAHFAYLWRNCEAMTSRLTSDSPTINVVANTPAAEENVNAVQTLLDQWWDEDNMQSKFAAGTRASLWVGDAFYYTYWDVEAGRPCTEVVSNKCIYVNEEATSIEDCTALCHKMKMPIWKVHQMWPKSKGKVAPGGMTDQTEDADFYDSVPVTQGNGQRLNFDTTRDGTTYQVTSTSDFFGQGGKDTDIVEVFLWWLRDPKRVKEPMYWEDGLPGMFPDGTPMWYDKPVYPGGRYMVQVGRRIVYDEPNPFQHGEFPYVQQKCYPVPDEFWSLSFAYPQLSPQRELDKTIAIVTEHQNLMAQPRIIADRNSGLDPQLDVGKPGTIWWKNPNTTVDPVQMPDLPASTLNMIGLNINAMKEISGINDASAGIKPSGIQSGVALQTLAISSQSQGQTLEKGVDDTIRRLGEQRAGLARQYSTEARQVQVTDDQGNTKWVEVTPEMIRDDWGMRIGKGSTLPVDRTVLFEQAIQALQVGLLDVEGALKYWRHPEAQQVLKRLKAQQEQQAQMQEQMQGAYGRVQQNAQAVQGFQNEQPEMMQ